ncbi:MAG: histidinol-phosphate transaminase, partial [Victivallales bacterium]|nr:histidinol-phosphate transaminase [Victivallales bacterium]
IKLNTNENPYPPSPAVGEAVRAFDWTALRLYPDPTGSRLRKAAGELFGFSPECILCGNGSDDLLTIALRTFVSEGAPFAYTTPSYSLYPVLADIQGACHRPVLLNSDFSLPEDIAEQAGDAALLILARPNAPTGNSFPMEKMRRLCRDFGGVVWIDEAYADFAEDNCLELAKEFPNVVVSRTFSKSYSLAGLRLGLAFSSPALTAEMMKVKDSYNIDRFSQEIGLAALLDQEYLAQSCSKVRATRERVADALRSRGCTVLPSETNFIFVQPAVITAEALFNGLREAGIITRYFPHPGISQYLRISIGTDAEMDTLMAEVERLDR